MFHNKLGSRPAVTFIAPTSEVGPNTNGRVPKDEKKKMKLTFVLLG